MENKIICPSCNSKNTSIIWEIYEAVRFTTSQKKLICSDCNHVKILKETDEHNEKLVWFDNEK